MVESFTTRILPLKYCSEANDLVIGRIIERQGEHYRVDLSDRFEGLLQYYDFEGATKRNRPTLESGDLIYARVQRASINSNAILTCKSSNNKKTWSSGEAEYGPLLNGYCFNCPISLCQLILSPKGNKALELIGSAFKFDVTIGFNGKIWIKASDPRTVVIIVGLLGKINEDERILIDTMKKLNMHN